MYEAVLVAGEDSFKEVDIRVRVKGGGHTSQVYAIRQAIAKALVAYYAKYIDAYSSLELKKKLIAYDRTLLIADPRRMEPKKFGGAGARARRQKRYGEFLIRRFLKELTFVQLSLSGCVMYIFFWLSSICYQCHDNIQCDWTIHKWSCDVTCVTTRLSVFLRPLYFRDMLDLPSSFPPVIESPFFHRPDGQRIFLFVEAGGILHRPRLVRTLKV